ncbi:MAG: hypothetical protein GY858_07240 [Candidatus Omnitrophica bacterium]|nr:hypothetical protein [Candidatus Omnitrophota bacterium]
MERAKNYSSFLDSCLSLRGCFIPYAQAKIGKIMNIDGVNTVCVVGWAKSGIALCDLLLSLKKKIKVTDSRVRSSFDTKLINAYINKGVEFEFGAHSEKFIKDSQLGILSPGVDVKTSEAAKCFCNLGTPFVGEIEFASWLTRAKFIAITGTNGKTTTSFLTHKVLKTKRKRVFLGGNIGVALSSFVMDTKKGDLIVLEISSFQLETIIEFKPFVAVFLNIEPDHLDRYCGFEDYFKAKMNIFKNQGKEDWAVLNKKSDLKGIVEKCTSSKILTFSDEFENENFSCVYRIASIFGLSKTDCVKVFSDFAGLPHRLQTVGKLAGVTFINDSKATNPSSTAWALKNTKGKVILISGGKDKGVDYKEILPFAKKIKKVNLFGEAANKIKEALKAELEIGQFPSLKSVIEASFKEAKKGDTVLFSPMCSSFDMFSSYIERGEKFSELVKELK